MGAKKQSFTLLYCIIKQQRFLTLCNLMNISKINKFAGKRMPHILHSFILHAFNLRVFFDEVLVLAVY